MEVLKEVRYCSLTTELLSKVNAEAIAMSTKLLAGLEKVSRNT